MATITYNWTRFFSPRDGELHLDFRGYLSDPVAGDGKYLNPKVVPLAALAGAPCLVLLGEPGAGKSTTLACERERETARIEAEGAASLWLDLREVDTWADLSRQIEQHPAWTSGDLLLYLFLDSLDECPVGLGIIAERLPTLLKKRHRALVRPRLVCRTSEWPASLERQLREKWSELQVYEIAPLRRVDVESASRAHGLEPSEVIATIAAREATVFALRPLTLRGLLTRLKTGNALPNTKRGLFADFCEHLCHEPSESRDKYTISPRARVALAARIAASLLFCRKRSVFRGASADGMPSGSIGIGDLVGNHEPIEGTAVAQALEPSLHDALKSGLFSSRGLDLLGFAHHSLAEYLAAQYVHIHCMSWLQIRALFYHPRFDRIIPSLHGVAAWYASMDVTFFDYTLQRDPHVLLDSDAALLDDSRKQRLVGLILQRYDEQSHIEQDFGRRYAFEKLAHTDIDAQLRAYILGTNRQRDARHVAIDMSIACKRRSVCDALIALLEHHST